MEWTGLLGVALGGAISFTGTWLQGHVSSRSEQQKRTAAAAIAARDALLQIEAMEMRWHDIEGAGRVPIHPEITPAVQAVRAEVMLITDRKVRDRLDQVTDLLLDSTSIGAFHRDHEQLVRRRLCSWGREVLGAHLRGDKQQSNPPKFLAEYTSAVEDADEAARNAYESDGD